MTLSGEQALHQADLWHQSANGWEASDCECCGAGDAECAWSENDYAAAVCEPCYRNLEGEADRRRHDLRVMHCPACRARAWPPKDVETRLRTAQILGVMVLCPSRSLRAVDIRKYLGGGVTIWPWMLQELADFGVVVRVNPGEGRRGFEEYALPDPIWRHTLCGRAR